MKEIDRNQQELQPETIYEYYLNCTYNECLEKSSHDIGSAVCGTVHTIYLSLCTETAKLFLRNTLKLCSNISGLRRRLEV